MKCVHQQVAMTVTLTRPNDTNDEEEATTATAPCAVFKRRLSTSFLRSLRFENYFFLPLSRFVFRIHKQ